jgi:hypothetical protein
MSKRQLVLCFDGTNNNLTGGRADTNVVKLCEVLTPTPEGQLLYYDPGVGNPGTIPGVGWMDWAKGWFERIKGLALGKGIYENIAAGYLFLMRNWKPGDDIYVFGFSRGAFTARSVAGMVARFGIMHPAMEEMVPTLLHLYFIDPHKAGDKYDKIKKQIAESFCSPEGAKAEVWFTGVWDTVESVGSLLSRRSITVPPTILGKRFRHVAQAHAIDEHRRSFRPRPYYIHPDPDIYAKGGQSIAQEWWSGSHCDVGGGYALDESELSDQTFAWMLDHALDKGLVVPDAFLSPDRKLDLAKLDAALQERREGPSKGPLVHSESFYNAYWALTGLWVREFNDAEGNPGDPPPKPPVQHPQPKPLRMPQDTVWRDTRIPYLFYAFVAVLVIWALHGLAIWGMPSTLASSLGQISRANEDLAFWQLTWWLGEGDYASRLRMLHSMAHPILAILLDLLLIAAYGYILACAIARAFAKRAGLRNVTDPAPRLLNAVGWCGALILGGDLLENAFMLLALTAGSVEWMGMQIFLAWLMSIASAVKWLGFIPALLLIVRVGRVGQKQIQATQAAT